jgi:hypothetical protein
MLASQCVGSGSAPRKFRVKRNAIGAGSPRIFIIITPLLHITLSPHPLQEP